jgi:hypothetical protein
MKGLAVGVLYLNQISGQVREDGSVHYRSLYQLIPAVATGVRLAGGIVRLGYSFQWVNQASGDKTVAADADPLGYNQGLAQGSAFSHNLGFALTLPFRYLPSFNVVARNVATAKFRSNTLFELAKNPNGLPPDEPMTVDGSVSIQPKVGQGGIFNLVLQYRDATNRSQVPIWGRLAAGGEFGFREQFFLRGGWGSGYPNVGVGFKRRGGEFSLTWYSEELGAGYHQQRDIRFLVHYQMRAF